jgi:hypothetical protein
MNAPAETYAMPYWVDLIVKLTPAFVTLVVGGVGAWIAYAQYRLGRLQHQLNQDRLRLDLFSKRLEAYEKLQEFFIAVIQAGTVQDSFLSILGEARYKSRFLFGEEISSYLDDTWKKAVDMRYYRQKLFGPQSIPQGPQRDELCSQDGELLKWMIDQPQASQSRYAIYLKFD